MKAPSYPSRKVRRKGRRAFTLVELLAALAVFALIMVLFSQTTAFVALAVTGSENQVDATEADRSALDALEHDLASAVTQQGLTVDLSQDGQNNAQLAFLTQCRGPSSTSSSDFRLMAVAYLLRGNQLIRQVTPVLWSDTNLEGIVVGNASSSTYSPSTTSSVLSNQMLRLEAVVQLDDSSIATYSSSATWLSPVAGSTFAGLVLSTAPVGASATPRVRSLIVAVASVDQQLMRLPAVSTIGSKLGSTSASFPTPLDYWDSQIAGGALAGFPKPAVAGLEFYQRVCQLK
jgi:prepilin-type N-terminal cleavage/methylation domain-containing protein